MIPSLARKGLRTAPCSHSDDFIFSYILFIIFNHQLKRDFVSWERKGLHLLHLLH